MKEIKNNNQTIRQVLPGLIGGRVRHQVVFSHENII